MHFCKLVFLEITTLVPVLVKIKEVGINSTRLKMIRKEYNWVSVSTNCILCFVYIGNKESLEAIIWTGKLLQNSGHIKHKSLW